MSDLPPIQRETRDGHAAVIRPIAPRDAGAVLALERAIAEAGEGVVLTARDLDDEAALRRALVSAAYRDPHRGIRLVAEVGGTIAGTAAIGRQRPGLCRHVATLAVGVHPQFQGRGVGRFLVERALDWPSGPGRAEPPVTRVELSVRADNQRAIALYLSLGFAVEGTRRAGVRTPDGALVDDHLMVTFVE